MAERLAAGYVYPWLAALLSIVLYGLLFLKLRGNIVVIPDRWARVRFVWRPARDGSDQQAVRYSFAGQATATGSAAMVGEDSVTLAQREARKMLWYPLCYTVRQRHATSVPSLICIKLTDASLDHTHLSSQLNPPSSSLPNCRP